MKTLLSLLLVGSLALSSFALAQSPPATLERQGAALMLQPPSLASIAARAALQDKRSISYETRADGTFGLTFLADGRKGFAGITINPLRSRGKLTLNGLLVSDTAGVELYAGGIALYEVYRSKDIAVCIGVGAKGLDLSSFSFEAARQPVFGFTVKGKV